MTRVNEFLFSHERAMVLKLVVIKCPVFTFSSDMTLRLWLFAKNRPVSLQTPLWSICTRLYVTTASIRIIIFTAGSTINIPVVTSQNNQQLQFLKGFWSQGKVNFLHSVPRPGEVLSISFGVSLGQQSLCRFFTATPLFSIRSESPSAWKCWWVSLGLELGGVRVSAV